MADSSAVKEKEAAEEVTVPLDPAVLADGCRTGVIPLSTGDLAFAGDDEIRVLDDPLR